MKKITIIEELDEKDLENKRLNERLIYERLREQDNIQKMERKFNKLSKRLGYEKVIHNKQLLILKSMIEDMIDA